MQQSKLLNHRLKEEWRKERERQRWREGRKKERRMGGREGRMGEEKRDRGKERGREEAKERGRKKGRIGREQSDNPRIGYRMLQKLHLKIYKLIS